MAEIYNWETDAADNDANPPNGWPEGMSPRQMNDTGREMLAVLARYRESAEGCIVTTGDTDNIYMLSVPQTFSGTLPTGSRFAFCAHRTCLEGTCTLQINTETPVQLIGTLASGVSAGDIRAGLAYVVSFDGTDMILLNPTVTAISGLFPLSRIPATLTGKDADTVDSFHISTDDDGDDANTIYFLT